MTQKILIEQGKPYFLPECPEEPDFKSLKKDKIYGDYKFFTGYKDSDVYEQYQAALKSTKRIKFADHPLLDFYVKDGLYPVPTGYTVEVKILSYEDAAADGLRYIATKQVAILKPLPNSEPLPEEKATDAGLFEKALAQVPFGVKKEVDNEISQFKPVEKEPESQEELFDDLLSRYFKLLHEGHSMQAATDELTKHFTLTRKGE